MPRIRKAWNWSQPPEQVVAPGTGNRGCLGWCTLPEEPPPSPVPPKCVFVGSSLCWKSILSRPWWGLRVGFAYWTSSDSRAHFLVVLWLCWGAQPLAFLCLLVPLRVPAWSSAFQAAPVVRLRDLGLLFLISLSFLGRQGEAMKRSKPVSASWPPCRQPSSPTFLSPVFVR